MLNSRFAIQVHIISLLAISKDAITSEFIAGSINCNAVLVRKELSILKKAGLIETLEGKNGGVKLLQEPQKIYLDDLFKITYDGAELFAGNKNEPNPLCPIGRNINGMMSQINAKIEIGLLKELHKTSIADLVKKVVQ